MKKIVITALLAMMLGCSTTGENTNTGGPTTKPGSTIAGLKTFSSCSEVSLFLVSREGTVRSGETTVGAPESAPEGADGAATADAPSPTAAPQTMTVEEADIVKQEGNRLYIANSYSGLLIYDLTVPSHPQRVGRVPLTGMTPLEIQVSGNKVLVVSNSYYEPKAKVSIIDVTDPSSPTIVKGLEFDGTYQESRKVGGAVYLVLQNWVGGDEKTIESQLNTKTPCDQVYIPDDLQGGGYPYFNSWDVVGINLNDLSAEPNTISIIGDYASTVYATPDHFYLTNYFFEENKTGIYLLDLKPATAGIAPLANASVPGSIVNQFSMDETGGVFRIASTTQPQMFWVIDVMPALVAEPPAPTAPEAGAKNYITTFSLSGGKLTQLGQIDTIVPGEVITAARFLGSHAFVTTAIEYFDPLVSVDLSNPAAPVVTASLDLPGRPGYLHAWGNLLITVGQGDGWEAGVTLNLFNIADRDHPVLIEQETIPDAYYSEAQWDHRAFAFFEDRGTLAIPVWGGLTSKIVLYRVSAETGLVALGAVDHMSLLAGMTTEDYSPNMRRAIEAGNVLITISEAGIKATGFDDLIHDLFGELFPDFGVPVYGCGCTGDVCMGCPQSY